MGVEDRLQEGLSRIPPADPGGAYERVVEKKVRRRVVRRVQTIAFAAAVFAGTALGFALLVRPFDMSRTTLGDRRIETPTPTSDPAPSESPQPGRDIGLRFRVCDAQRLGGIDLLGDGTPGTAWTAAPLNDNGGCPKAYDAPYIVAVDQSGDGVADDYWGDIENCFFCRPYGRFDMDADGDDELVVLTSEGSTPQFMVFTLQPADGGAWSLRPVTVAPPGIDEANLVSGEPLKITTGGDEGFTGAVACEGPADEPVFVRAWTDHPIDGDVREIHITKLELLEEGTVRIVASEDYSAPVSDALPWPFGTNGRACGVDLDPWI